MIYETQATSYHLYNHSHVEAFIQVSCPMDNTNKLTRMIVMMLSSLYDNDAIYPLLLNLKLGSLIINLYFQYNLIREYELKSLCSMAITNHYTSETFEVQ